MEDRIREKLSLLPDKPGVYLMLDDKNNVIYVGKAKILKNRVRQYFQKNIKGSKTMAMVENINDFNYIITDTEIEALILECNMIKEKKPKYNILLRDDKSYPYIKVTINESFPRLMKTRKILKDGSKYYGPYTDIWALNETIDYLKKIYPIRNCNKNIKKLIEKRERPCLNYHIKKCLGPCTGKLNKEKYNEMIREIILFLEGKEGQLLKNLKEKMDVSAREQNFEQAIKYRDKLMALKTILEKQKITNTEEIDQDVIAVAKDEYNTIIQVFFIRKGKLIERKNYDLDNNKDESIKEIIESFIKQYYSGLNFIPKEILIEEELDDISILMEWLTDKKGQKVSIKQPKKGQKKRVLNMVKENAKNQLNVKRETIKKKESMNHNILGKLKELIGLDDIPNRIEAFDISNIQGVESVGSMVVFEGIKPNNKEYRRFKIKTVEGPDDYKSIEEIIMRRFKRGLKESREILNNNLDIENKNFINFPDIILIDGGKGQVNIVKKVLYDLGIDIPICGMVKDDKHRTRAIIINNIEYDMKDNLELRHFITRVQDEVHRFAINYHRSLLKNKSFESKLDKIKGIGKIKRRNLLTKFKSIDDIKNASIEDLIKVDGVNKKDAENLKKNL